MVRDEQQLEAASPSASDFASGSGGASDDSSTRGAAPSSSSSVGGMTRAAASSAPDATPAPSSIPVSAPAARRLARTQTVIEHLQLNLSSRLKESTVQALRSSYAGGRALSAPEASSSEGTSEGITSVDDKVDGIEANGSTQLKNHLRNGSVPVEKNEDVVLRKNFDTNSSPESDSSIQKSSPESRKSKPRVSWTTKLLERLTQEESQKKERAEQQRAARSQRRLVRYPGQKDFVPTHVSPIAKRVSSVPPQASVDRKPLPEKNPVARSRSADTPPDRAQPPPPPPRRSTLSNASEPDGGKDGYADLISELTTSKNDERARPKSLSTDLYKSNLQSDKVPRRKTSASDLFRIESVEKLNDQIDSVPRPKSAASDLLSPDSVFDSSSPCPRSPPAVSKIAGDTSRKSVEGDYFVFSKEFVEANAHPLYARPRRFKPETSSGESSSKIRESSDPRAMNSPEEKRSSYGSSRPSELSKKPLSLVNNLSFDEDSMISRGGSQQQSPVRQGTVELPGYSSDTGRLKGHSPLVRGGSPASTKSSPGDVRLLQSKGNQRSPLSDTPSGGGGRPRSASPRSTRKSPGSGRSTPSGLRRLLSPASLFSSSRHRPASGPSEEVERRSLLAPAKVHPVQNKPIVETAFLSNASPTKQNQANQSRRSKSVSPNRERAHHHPQHIHELPQQHHHVHQQQQQQHIHQPQPTRSQQLQAPPPSPSSPISPTQQQQYHQHHHIPILQPAPIRLSPRQVSPMHVSPSQGSPHARASPLQSSPRAHAGLQESSYGSLQGSPVSQGSPGQRSSSALQDSPNSQSSSQPSPPRNLRIEERFQQLRRELSPASSASSPAAAAVDSRGGSRLSTASDALLSLPPPAPRRDAQHALSTGGGGGFSPRSCDSPDSVGATFVRSRRDVQYASLPTRYASRPSSAPLHFQQPIYENVQARYVAPIALDLERNAISGSPDIRQQLQQQKRQILLQQRRQQEQLLLLQQQTHLGGGGGGGSGRSSNNTSPFTSVASDVSSSSTYGMVPSSPRSAAGTPTASSQQQQQHQQQRALYEQHQRVRQYEQMRRAQLQHEQMAQQLPVRCSSAEPVQLRHKPIFKRGSLVAEAVSPTSPDGGSATPKRVSFTGGEQRGGGGVSGEPRAWPTRNGPASTPPTRQHVEVAVHSRHTPLEHEAPNRPLPPVPLQHLPHLYYHSESESGSEAGEVQRILMRHHPDEEWGTDGKARGPPGSDHAAPGGGRGDDELRRSGGGGARSGRRDEPRRHTLSGDHHHQHQAGSLARSMDLESPLPRGYPPPSTAMLFDDDPGIMSEVETSSTGFRRGGKQRSSLPVVRTPSKTLERPLGLVFLQYRSETKRALLPNEITSIDTVKALFVRSFPKQLTMEYLDSPHVKIYIHDSSKDMFYELEDVRSHLRDIRDRSVLRLFESADINGGVLPGAGVGVMAPSMWDQDQSYFSEPEFDSEYQHQHIHKSKTSSKGGQQPYYMTHSYPPGGAAQGSAPATLPRGGPLLRAYSPAVVPPVPADRMKTLPQSGVHPPPKPVRMYQQVKGPLKLGPRVPERTFASFSSPSRGRATNIYSSPDRLHSESGYMSSPERGGPRAYPTSYTSGAPGYEDPYYSQYASRSGSITPVIDEEARLRVENMERQLANLTGLVQKALTQTPTPREYLQVPAASRDANYRNDETYLRTDTKPPKLGKDKSVSFEKSVSFSDEPPDMNSPKQHSPQHTADSKPTKPAIKSSTLPRMSSQERTERDRHKPAPPPKPVSLSPGQYEGRHVYRDLHLTPEMYNQLRGLQKKAKDLRQEVRNLRRMSQAQAHTVRETIRDTFIKIRTMLLLGGEEAWSTGGDAEKLRLSREEDAYKQEMLRLEKDLTELESTVEELRGNVINRKTRVNMSDVENMALILSKSSKTVADLKVRFPSLQEGMKGLLSSEMEKVVREEKFLKEEPERLESALRRCKKLTGTLVTLKRLASVQEQRLPASTPESRLSPTLGTDSDPPITPPAHGKTGTLPARGVLASSVSSGSDASLSRQRPENALDALLDELQTFARPPSNLSHNPSMSEIGRKGSIDSAHPGSGSPSLIPGTTSSLRRLHSYPSSSDGGGNSPPTVPLSRLQVSGPTDPPKSPATSPKPPVPERNSELLSQLVGRRVPPPPPPRTSSRSPLASPTSPLLPPKGQHPNQPQMGVGGGTLLRRGGSGRSSLREPLRGGIALPGEAKATGEDSLAPGTFNPLSASNSSSCESVNSQEGLQNKSGNKARQEILEQRHQELLRKQRALQEQYARLQQLQRGGGASLTVVPPPDLLLKKTGSESNLLAKMGLGHGLSAAAPISGSLRNLAAVAVTNPPIMSVTGLGSQFKAETNNPAVGVASSVTETTVATTNTIPTATTTNKIYETDIL